MSNWPHAPIHYLDKGGAFIVTAGTYLKAPIFKEPSRRDLLQNHLLKLAEKHCWHLQAWAIFSNHYHFIAKSPSDSETLTDFIRALHSITGRLVNELDNTPGRSVWYDYWETRLTYQRSYLARLKYVIENAVKHRLVAHAVDYKWCSAAWFEEHATAGFRRAVHSFKTDQVNVEDPY